MIKRLALPFLLLASSILPAACATAGQYEGVANTAMALDSLAGSLRVMDASLTPSLRTATYKADRDKAVQAVTAAADLLPAGCEGSPSSAIATAAAGARLAVQAITSMIKGPAPTMAMRIKMASMDPAAIAGIVNGSIGALLQLVTGGMAIYSSVQASQGQTIAQAKTACEVEVAKLIQDLQNLTAALHADDAAVSQ